MQPRPDFFNSFELPIRFSLTIVQCAHTHKAQHHISRLGKLQRLKDINLRAAKKKLNSCIIELSNWMGSPWVKERALMLLGPTILVWGLFQ
jgi:hypothetical protein